MTQSAIKYLVITAVVVMIGAIASGSYISAHNYGNAAEKSLLAKMDSNRNALAQYGQKVLEAAQVPAAMRNDAIKVVEAAMQGRYGENGSTAAVQWIKEQNPNLDPKLYQNIQRMIEAGRSEFERKQDELLDQKRVYETALGTFWQGKWLAVAGYPKTDLSKIRIVSTAQADKAFETGREDAPLNLMQN